MVGGKREPGFCMILPATHRVAGHFGELIQGRLGTAGPVVLISLPCPALTVTATAIAAHDPDAARAAMHAHLDNSHKRFSASWRVARNS